MPRKLFSPAVKTNNSSMVSRMLSVEKPSRKVLMKKITMINDIRQYGYAEAILDYSNNLDKEYMAKFKGCSDKELVKEVMQLERLLGKD